MASPLSAGLPSDDIRPNRRRRRYRECLSALPPDSPPPRWRAGLAQLTAWNEEIRALEKRFPFVRIVDVHKVFLSHGIHCDDRANPHYDPRDPTYWCYWNLKDPSVRGYDAARRAYLRTWAAAHSAQRWCGLHLSLMRRQDLRIRKGHSNKSDLLRRFLASENSAPL